MNITKEHKQDGIVVSYTERTVKRKYKLITIQITAPNESFMFSEALTYYGRVPPMQEFFTNKVKTILSEYFAKAEEIFSKISS